MKVKTFGVKRLAFDVKHKRHYTTNFEHRAQNAELLTFLKTWKVFTQ